MGAMRQVGMWALILALLGSIGAGLGIQATHGQEKAEELSEKERKQLEQLVADLNSQVVVFSQKGKFDEAISLSEQSLALTQKLYPKRTFPDGHRDLATRLNNLGYLLQARGELVKAESFYRDALTMRNRLYPATRYKDGHPELATSLNNLGFLLVAQGKYTKAEQYFRDALVMFQALYPKERYPRGHPKLAVSLDNLGFLLRAQGEYTKAEPYFRDALAMFQALYSKDRYFQGHPDLAISLVNMGSLLAAQGEYAKAEPYYRDALVMRQALYPKNSYPQGHPDLAESLNNLGGLLQERGEHAKAEPYYRDALVMIQALYPKKRYPQGHPNLARCLSDLGILLRSQGEYTKAEPYLRDAWAMRQELFPKDRYPQGHPDLAISLNSLGFLIRAQGEYAKAEPYYHDALVMQQALYPKNSFPQGHPDLARSLNNLGFLHEARREYEKAEPFFRDALAMYQRLAANFANSSAEAESLNFLARLPDTRDAFLSVTANLPDAAPADAYAVLWQGKAALARVLERRQRLFHTLTDDADRGKLQELLDARRELARRILGPDQQEKDRDRRMKELIDRKEMLEKALAAKLPELKETQPPYTDLIDRLPNDAAFVDLFRFNHRPKGEKNFRPNYTAFILRKGAKVVRIDLGSAEPIEKAIAAWRNDITNDEIKKDLNSKAPAELRQLVWDKLAKHLPDTPGSTVYLCPDADLSSLPWAALPGRDKGTVLLEDHAIALVPHGPALLKRLLRKDKERTGADAVLALGGPRYDQAPDAARQPDDLADVRPAQRAAKDGVWPDLPGSAREAATVAALAGTLPKPPKVLQRSAGSASATQLYLDLPQVRWAHLATHGFFAAPETAERKYLFDEKEFRLGVKGFSGSERLGAGARHPLTQTGLVLTGANLKGKDAPADGGMLTAEAIAGLDLRKLDLAVLSACETGLGEGMNGEGVFGLQRAFHLGGCRSVLASLWKVDDDATAALMAVFYHELWVNDCSPIEALRRAQLALYRNPSDVKELARGRGPDFDKTVRRVTTPPPKGERPKKAAQIRDWAAFVLSGSGG